MPGAGLARLDDLHAEVEEVVGPGLEQPERSMPDEPLARQADVPTEGVVDVVDPEVDDFRSVVPDGAQKHNPVGHGVDEDRVQAIDRRRFDGEASCGRLFRPGPSIMRTHADSDRSYPRAMVTTRTDSAAACGTLRYGIGVNPACLESR